MRIPVNIVGMAALLACNASAFASTTLHGLDAEADHGRYIESWDTLFEDEHVAQTTPPATTPTTPTQPGTTPSQPEPPAVDQPDGTLDQAPEDGANEEDNSVDDEFSLGDLPVVETVELTPDGARKAVDTYILVRDKYKDAELENFENLQDFVDQAPQGKAFEADVKAAGFANVNDWNTVVTTISFAYANILDDQTDEIKQQIEEIKADQEMAQDMRDRMIAALSAMIPSDNNKKVVEDMIKDSVYGPKVKALETEEE